MQAACVVREHCCSEAADALNAMEHSLQSLYGAWSQPQNMQLLLTSLLICKYCAFTMPSKLAGYNIGAINTDCYNASAADVAQEAKSTRHTMMFIS